ncbi:MAG: putative Fe-S cluster assembly protein SufT [Chloroflexi bacterium]|nr:putative Fe-S cluster assembly protein SufT [Chloroflexota bacterium]
MWNDSVTISRDIIATEVPFGYEVLLAEGARVTVTQEMGSGFTVFTEFGQMVRIEAKDADAIGREFVPQAELSMGEVRSDDDVERLVWEQLRTCYDPEIPVNIADLGLIYGVQVTPDQEGNRKVDVQMTLTAPGCGMGEILKIEVEDKLTRIPTVVNADVELVFDPPWDMSMLPEAAKLQLGLL